MRVMECRAVRTRWVGSVRKCFAIGEKGGAVSIFRGSGQERGWREGGERVESRVPDMMKEIAV